MPALRGDDAMNLPLNPAIPTKPATFNGDLSNLPCAFKPYQARPVWLCWKWVLDLKRAKWTKPPFRDTGYRGSSTDPNTWCMYEQALAAVQAGKADGIGLALAGLDGNEIALDLDDCRDPATGDIAPWAKELVDETVSYCEVTVSGTGLRIIGTGDVGSTHTSFELESGMLEIFTAGAGRYITVSGLQLHGCWPNFARIDEITRRLIDNKGKLHAAEPHLEEVQTEQPQVETTLKAERIDLGLGSIKQSGKFFRNVNAAALAHLERWVPQLFPEAKFQQGTKAWRVSSKDLGRDYEEDLSIHPRGIMDWGPRKGLTPINLVMEHGGAANVLQAADWLCARCGMDPVALGRGMHNAPGQKGVETPISNSGNSSSQFILNSRNLPYSNVANVLTVLRTRPEWQGIASLDRMAAKIMLLKPIPDVSGRRSNAFEPRQLIDADVVKAVEWLQHNDLPSIRKEVVGDAISIIAEEHSHDPLEDKLRSLQWDQVPRIDRWLQDYCGAQINETQPEAYLRAVGRCWLIGAVARALRPGCKMDTALVLVGPQGIGKSTLGHILAYGEWFSDALPPVHSKDASDHLRGLWLIEFGEMAAARRAEIEDFKAFMTRTEERFRPAYGRFEISYPRRNVFFGTSNKDAFLRDETGNRRFWPVTVTSLDIARLEADRDQLWAEAVHAFDAGERWHLTDDESRLALVQQNAFTMVDERAEELSRKLMGRQKTTALECLDLLGFQQRGKAQQKEVTDMLKSLGWSKQTNGTYRYWVAPLTTSGSRGWSAGGLNDVDFG